VIYLDAEKYFFAKKSTTEKVPEEKSLILNTANKLFLGFILKTNSNTRYNKTDIEKICCHIFLITFCV
jgi:hypothetical protein